MSKCSDSSFSDNHDNIKKATFQSYILRLMPMYVFINRYCKKIGVFVFVF